MSNEKERLAAIRNALGRMAANGLPLVDTVFWSDPGLKLGGLLAFLLKKTTPATGGVFRLDLRPQPVCFALLSDLKRHLRDGHAAHYWYRGQRRRYETLYRGVIPRLIAAFPEIKTVEFLLESLTPSRYREIVAVRPAAWTGMPPPGPPLDAYAAPVRAILRSDQAELLKLFHEALQALAIDSIRLTVADRMKINWGTLAASGTNTSAPLAQLISVAQHYEYGSVMVDVTRSVDVALSFATHDWVSGARLPPPDGGGVIYRFDEREVDLAMQDLLSGGLRSCWLPPLAIFGITDIHDIGFDLRRPALQQGGSFFGVETAAAHFAMNSRDAFKVFTFEKDDLCSAEIPALASLRPEDDPGLAVFDLASRSRTEPIEAEEITAGLRGTGMTEEGIARILNWRRDTIV